MTRKATITPALRKLVLTRDGFTCRACGFGGSEAYIPFLDCDHAISEASGGATNADNLQCLCKHCNVAKGAADWAFAIRQPVDAEVWAYNHKVIASAFVSDTAKRMKKLK